jgi:hypothetical protein
MLAPSRGVVTMSRVRMGAAALVCGIVASVGVVAVGAQQASASPGVCVVRSVTKAAMDSPARAIPVRVACGVPLDWAKWAVISPSGVTLAVLTFTGDDSYARWYLPTRGPIGAYELVPRGCRSTTAGECVQTLATTQVRLRVAQAGGVRIAQTSTTRTLFSGVERYSRTRTQMLPWPYATLKLYVKAPGATTMTYVRTLRSNSQGSYRVTVNADPNKKWLVVAPATSLTFKTSVAEF